MGQAEQLLSDCQSGQYDHVPAAVLAGAVLERAFRILCDLQVPPVAKLNPKTGKSLLLNALISNLKKAKVFNELTAKQLRAWADIRNAAAHGKYEEFDKHQVEQMVQGINTFLSRHLTD